MKQLVVEGKPLKVFSYLILLLKHNPTLTLNITFFKKLA